MNPYKVLGVSENASFEEIRRAYLALVKKYHPDKYTDTDLKDLANEKLKEVNEAYDQLTKNKSRGTSASSSSGYSRSSYSGAHAEEYMRARLFINQGNLFEAQRILDKIADRNADWYYLNGIIYFRQNMHDRAAQHFETAYRMDPDNAEYRNAYNSVYSMGGYYRSGGRRYPNDSNSGGCSTCDICTGLLCADCCCEMMGGDLIPCC